MTESRSLRPADPVRLGPYELIEFWDQSGPVSTFVGRKPDGASVIIKLLPAPASENAQFMAAIEVARRVPAHCSPSIVALEDDRHGRYMVMAHPGGELLEHHVTRRGALTGIPLEKFAIGSAALLVGTHEHGVVLHRFTPQTVLLGPDGPQIISFDAATTQQTRTAHNVLGWGIVVAYAATGASTLLADTAQAADTARDLLSQTAMSEQLAALVVAALAATPDDRPSTRQILRSLTKSVT